MEVKHGFVYYYECTAHGPQGVPLRESPREARLDMVAHFVTMKSKADWGPCNLRLRTLPYQFEDFT